VTPDPNIEPNPGRELRPPAETARFAVLGSGSQGNALLVECGGDRLLIDAGFSCREIERRMGTLEADPASLGGIVITHEHNDHVCGADRLARRWELALWATAGTLDECRGLTAPARAQARVLASGRPVEIGGFLVEPFTVPHDAREPIGLVIESASGFRLGLVSDLGSRSRLAWGRLTELDALVLETNHDPAMLRNGPYPWALKQRVAGRHGHLSNDDAADGVEELVCDRLRWVVLYHLSRTNNLPALAAAAVGEVLSRLGAPAAVVLSEQNRPTPWMETPPSG
jgi:phosphoribosyl 1,2-cyclic phosphodiesterase